MSAGYAPIYGERPFGTPRDVTLQQLKIECVFPADAVTEQIARQLALPELVAV